MSEPGGAPRSSSFEIFPVTFVTDGRTDVHVHTASWHNTFQISENGIKIVARVNSIGLLVITIIMIKYTTSV